MNGSALDLPPRGEGGPHGRVGGLASASDLSPPTRALRFDPSREGEGGARHLRAWAAAASVPDPELPCVTIADLGILRAVDLVDGVAVATVTPTYSGCPAVLAIELAVEVALRDAGFEARVERAMSPAWTTAWITAEGREKLRAYGIAPPLEASSSIRSLFADEEVACPRCGSAETARISEFGSTACKAQWRCTACLEPFDYFKCI